MSLVGLDIHLSLKFSSLLSAVKLPRFHVQRKMNKERGEHTKWIKSFINHVYFGAVVCYSRRSAQSKKCFLCKSWQIAGMYLYIIYVYTSFFLQCCQLNFCSSEMNRTEVRFPKNRASYINIFNFDVQNFRWKTQIHGITCFKRFLYSSAKDKS